VIEAYNSTKDCDSDRISLRAYSLDTLKQALSEMCGEAPPSAGAQGAERAAQTAAQGGKAVKRKLKVRLRGSIAPQVCSSAVSRACPQAELEEGGRICADCLSLDDPHPLVDGRIAVQLGLITETYREHNLTRRATQSCTG